MTSSSMPEFDWTVQASLSRPDSPSSSCHNDDIPRLCHNQYSYHLGLFHTFKQINLFLPNLGFETINMISDSRWRGKTPCNPTGCCLTLFTSSSLSPSPSSSWLWQWQTETTRRAKLSDSCCHRNQELPWRGGIHNIQCLADNDVDHDAMTNILLWLKIFCLKERGGETPALGDTNRKEEVKTFDVTEQPALFTTVETITIVFQQ